MDETAPMVPFWECRNCGAVDPLECLCNLFNLNWLRAISVQLIDSVLIMEEVESEE
jgi:hypothetical protein